MTNAEFALNAKTKREIGELLFAFITDHIFYGKFLNIDEWLEKEKLTAEQVSARVDVLVFNEECERFKKSEGNNE